MNCPHDSRNLLLPSLCRTATVDLDGRRTARSHTHSALAFVRSFAASTDNTDPTWNEGRGNEKELLMKEEDEGISET